MMKNIYCVLSLGFSVFSIHISAQTLQWEMGLGNTGNESITAMDVDASGNVYITGEFFDVVDFDPSGSTANLSAPIRGTYFAKYNASGGLVYAKSISSSLDCKTNALRLANDGSIYITGEISGTVDFDPSAGVANKTGSSDIFLAKYDNAGNYVWAHVMGTASLATVSDAGADVAFANNGDVYLTGCFGGTVDFDPSSGTSNLTSAGEVDVFLASYTNAGSFNWVKKFGGSSYDFPKRLATDVNGNISVYGSFENTVDFDPSAATANLSAPGDPHLFLANYDNQGNYNWAIKIGNGDEITEKDMVTDNVGSIYITGSFFDFVDFDPSASTVELEAFGMDAFLAKYDPDGNFIWAHRFGGNSSDFGARLAVDPASNVFITGGFEEQVDFDPSSSVANLTPINSSSEIFLAGYTSDGNFISAASIRTFNGFDDPACLAISADNHIYIGGNFREGLGLNFNTQTLTSAGGNDIFVAKYKNELLFINENEAGSFVIFPNPTTNFINISLKNPLPVDIYNMSGALVCHFAEAQSHVIDVSNLPSGIYVVRTGRHSTKFIKE